MAAVTVSEYSKLCLPGLEAVVVTASTTNTYTCQTLSKVSGAVATMAEATALNPNLQLTWSGNTVTITCTGLSSNKVSLLIWGN
jgi:hypothetical protein